MSAQWGGRAHNALIAILICAASAGCKASRAEHLADTHAGDKLRAEIAASPEGDRAMIQRLWTDYLASKTVSYGCQLSKYWAESEQGVVGEFSGIPIHRCFDLATSSIWPSSQRRDVIAIEPVSGSKGAVYRITTRFRTDSTKSAPKPRTTIITVFAIREGEQWKLSSALRQTSASWRKETVGPFTYRIAPDRKFSRARADSAVAFADSLAIAFDVPRLKPLDYYVVESGDAMMMLYGVQFDTLYGTAGGQSMPGMLVSGDPVFAENHGHEIAHTVLLPLYIGKRLHVVASEGVPTWLGGTRGMRYPAALRALRQYLIDNPAATIDTVLAGNATPVHNPGAALLSAMVHEHAGVPGIRQFFDTGWTMNEFKTSVEKILGKTWSEIGIEWKQRALAAQ